MVVVLDVACKVNTATSICYAISLRHCVSFLDPKKALHKHLQKSEDAVFFTNVERVIVSFLDAVYFIKLTYSCKCACEIVLYTLMGSTFKVAFIFVSPLHTIMELLILLCILTLDLFVLLQY